MKTSCVLHNLPHLNQCRQIKTYDINLKFGAVLVVDNSFDDSILALSAMQVHADAITDLEFSFWFLRLLGHGLSVITNRALQRGSISGC